MISTKKYHEYIDRIWVIMEHKEIHTPEEIEELDRLSEAVADYEERTLSNEFEEGIELG